MPRPERRVEGIPAAMSGPPTAARQVTDPRDAAQIFETAAARVYDP